MAGIVMFTPLPPQPNGIADYAFELLGALAARMDCAVVVEDGIAARAPPGVAVLAASEYRAGDFADALAVYHLGNNPDHVYLLPFLAARPGLVVLHDPALHHLLDCATVALGDIDGYVRALAGEYGAAGRTLGEQFRAHWLREQVLYFDLPMLRGLLGPARGVVVHSRFAAAKVLAQVPDAAVSVIPHHYRPPAALPPRASVRAALGVAPDELLFVSLGFVGRNKLIDAALRALALVADRLPPWRYLIAGELRPHEVDVLGLAAALGLGARLITPGYVAEGEFFALLEAADVVINLRHPVGGETSGTLVRALGAGACTVVVDRGAFAEIPDGAAVKLAWHAPGFDARLAEALAGLAADPARRARIGAAAAAAVRDGHDLEATADRYATAIAAAREAAPRPWATGAAWEYPARQAPVAAAAPLWARIGAVPDSATPFTALLAGDPWPGADLLPAPARRLRPLPLARLTAPRPSHKARGIDLLLVAADADALPADPRALLAGCNRSLAFGGVLVLHLSRGKPRRQAVPALEPPALEHRARGTALLEACGFTVQLAATGDALPPPDQELRVWRAVKSSEFIAAGALAA